MVRNRVVAFSSKIVAEQKEKPGNALFIRLPRLVATIRTPYRQYRILREYNEFTAISRGIKQYKQILETKKMQF